MQPFVQKSRDSLEKEQVKICLNVCKIFNERILIILIYNYCCLKVPYRTYVTLIIIKCSQI